MAGQDTDISWAMKLLEREPEYEQNFLAKNWAYICAPAFSMSVPITLNCWLNRPMWSGIQRIVIFGLGGYAAGHLITEQSKYLCARRDAQFRDYIRLHPDDFPPPDRKTWGELFESWTPVR